MAPKDMTQRLEANLPVFRALFDALPLSAITWRPKPEKWSFLEVSCHLLDEEREDFRARISSIFRDPEAPFEPINPVEWVTSRFYADQDFDSVCEGFCEERKKSIEWLHLNMDQDWSAAYVHPKFGPMSAAYLLSNWLAHDHLHINQWNRMAYHYLKSQGHDLSYAGPELKWPS